ncbi:tyrosine-type recombinase/integrase [Arthrobacter sp. NicSoilB8]|uniref:tyrosine-type recombinase/integrase n=1 Tax=Arthrobacter sp. NicSoilB8 TaxID=2830998 RepID=UPI001E80EC28|nr:tyrosine-type recombinase/integrase [Arthrobacter sp. NicSoilB8]BCW69626.1 hypothetical protein NicSoilB8_06700 [Arthrobacter sp. NicSoilB8]
MASESKYPALVLVLAYSGFRWGEATGLRVKDLDMLKRRFLVTENAVEVGTQIVAGTPKNHKRRSKPFPKFLADLLAQQCEGKHRDDLVFAGEDGGYRRSARVLYLLGRMAAIGALRESTKTTSAGSRVL